MCADSRKAHDLGEGRQVSREFTGSENFGFVRQVFLWRDHTVLSTGEFEFFVRLQRFMSVEIHHLHLNVDETRGMVDEDASAGEHFSSDFFTC